MQERIYQLIIELKEKRNTVSQRIEKEQFKQKQNYNK
jgi:hypothetical protein